MFLGIACPRGLNLILILELILPLVLGLDLILAPSSLSLVPYSQTCPGFEGIPRNSF